MSRTGSPTTPTATADPRIPLPHSETATACKSDPRLFDYDYSQTKDQAETEQRLRKAQRACSTCPLRTGCLKWALANPDDTLTGVWAATTPRQRQMLRRRVEDRLGLDWVDVVAAADRARAQGHEQLLNPPVIAEQAPDAPHTPTGRAQNQGVLLTVPKPPAA